MSGPKNESEFESLLDQAQLDELILITNTIKSNSSKLRDLLGYSELEKNTPPTEKKKETK